MTDGRDRVDTWCPNCGEPAEEDTLRECVICRTLFCPACAVRGYGREFCSTRCRDFFFFGDGEEEAAGEKAD